VDTPASAVSWSVGSDADEVVAEVSGEQTLRKDMANYRLVRRAVTRKRWLFWIGATAVFVGYQFLFVSILDGLLWLFLVLILRYSWLYLIADVLSVFSKPVDRFRLSREGFIMEGKDFRWSMGWKQCWIIEGDKRFAIVSKRGQSLFLPKDTLAVGTEDSVRDFATRNGLVEKSHASYTAWNMDGLSQKVQGTRPPLRSEGVVSAQCKGMIQHPRDLWPKTIKFWSSLTLMFVIILVKLVVPVEDFMYWLSNPGDLMFLIILTFLAFILLLGIGLGAGVWNTLLIRRSNDPAQIGVVPGNPPVLQVAREEVCWEFSLRSVSALRRDKESLLVLFNDGAEWIRFFFDEEPGTGKRGEMEAALRQYFGPSETRGA